MKAFALALGLIYSSLSFAESAVRYEGENHRDAEARVNADSTSPLVLSRTRYNYNQLDFTQLLQFPSVEEMNRYFEDVRDTRFIDDPSYSILRRPSWMYPDDGCWIRAQLMNYRMNTLTGQKMHKVFIYGDLRVTTEFNPSGRVLWWFHVVPIAKVGDTPYVFDPAIDSSGPITFRSWALRQVRRLGDAQFEICHPDTYGTKSRCRNPPRPNYSWVRERQSKYLSLERKRLRNMGFDASSYLGNSPPWRD